MFNATIKRDFSLRKRYTVYGSVKVIKQMILYYSTHKPVFHTTPRWHESTHLLGKRLSLEVYKKVDMHNVLLNDNYLINVKHKISIKHRTCSCGKFLKWAVCGHILGYVYKNPRLDAVHWFGDVKYTNVQVEFNHNMKRGRKNKKSGRYHNSEKALSKY